MLVNPPTPDGSYYIRSQHRVGRKSRENMIWPQVSLAQLAALLDPSYTVKVIDANAEQMTWKAFEEIIRRERPRYYITQLTAPTLQNDLYGTFIAKSVGAVTMAFGTHITPMPRETLRPFPSLDYGLRGEPDLTMRDLIDHLEGRQFNRPDDIVRLFEKHDPAYRPQELQRGSDGRPDLAFVKGLVWRHGETSSPIRTARISPISMTCQCRCIICCRCRSTGCRSSRDPSPSSSRAAAARLDAPTASSTSATVRRCGCDRRRS